ncbi:hypothetical protein [Roseovarius amoyensis]|uniref:hypothetical protein n=1 Tax=Roseovarius amoyensis TaxID=2211448 RepID=UPI000DBE86FF|nr:hypothetical protein [Roseovarius amoyensis]
MDSKRNGTGRFIVTVCMLGLLSAPAAEAQEEYPGWIADRYCKTYANEAACRASLKLSELLGKTSGQASNMDVDGSGQVDQWPASTPAPRLARCIYRHPRRPDWDFDEDCFFTSDLRISAFATISLRVQVKNGNGFILERIEDPGEPMKYNVNEHPATSFHTMQGDECYKVTGTGETFCAIPVDKTSDGHEPKQVAAGQSLCRVYDVLYGGVPKLLDEEACVRSVRQSREGHFIIDFLWPSGARTAVESQDESVYNAFRINGQNAGHPNIPAPRPAQGESRQHDCAMNFATSRFFCFASAGDTAGDTEEAVTEPVGDEAGWCLLKQISGPDEALLDHGRCRRTGKCSVGEASGEETCEHFYVWESNRTTHVTKFETTHFIDGKLVSDTWDGCVFENETLSTFCYSKTAFDPDVHPILLQQPDKPITRQGWCAWRFPSGEVDVAECTLTRGCPPGSGGCEYRFEWRDGRVTTASTGEDIVGMIDASGVEGLAQWWPGRDPKCATSKKRKAEFCFSAESKAAVMP